MYRRLLLLAALIVWLPLHTFAQQEAPVSSDQPATNNQVNRSDPPAGGGGWVISGFLGGSHTSRSSLTISQPGLGNEVTFQNIELRSEAFKSPLYYGLRVGYFLPKVPWLGVETEFIHLKVFANAQQTVRATGTYH